MTEPWAAVDDYAKHLGAVRDSSCRCVERRGLPEHKICRLWKLKLTEVDPRVRAGGAGPEQDRGNVGDR
jgi:hypothetical protein